MCTVPPRQPQIHKDASLLSRPHVGMMDPKTYAPAHTLAQTLPPVSALFTPTRSRSTMLPKRIDYPPPQKRAASTTPRHITFPGIDQIGRGTRRSAFIDRGAMVQPTSNYDERLKLGWQGTVAETGAHRPDFMTGDPRRSAPSKSRELWKRINAGFDKSEWRSIQTMCPAEDEKYFQSFQHNFHIPKTDMNKYANSFAVHYPKAPKA